MDLATVKTFLRVTHAMEDDLIELLMDMAAEEIKDSVAPSLDRNEDYFVNNHIYDHALLILTKTYYDSRDAVSEVNLVEIPFGVMGAINKMRGAYIETN